MAIDGEIETVRKRRSWRTFRIQIFCDANLPQAKWRVEWLRGYVDKNADNGSIVGEEVQNTGISIVKTAAELSPKTFTLQSGKTITGAEIMEVLAQAGDTGHQEHIDRANQPPEPEPEPEPQE